MFAPKSVSRGVAGSYGEVYYMGIGDSVFAQSFHCNREFRGQGWSAVLISRNPRKAMFAPKSVSRGVAGSYCGYITWVLGITVFAIFPLQQRISRPSCSAVLIFRNPRKAMFASLGGLRDRTVEYTTWVLGITVFAQPFHCNREFRGQGWSAVLISRKPRKAMFAPKVSLGGLRDRTVEYTTWVLGITVFAQPFHCNREFRGQGWSAVLISRKPRKAMFAPKSVSRGVAGSYC